MLNKWKKHFIQTQKGAYKNATLAKIDTHWLIFDSETEEAFSFTPETFADFEIKGYLKAIDEWVSLQYYSEQYLQADEKLLPVTENMPFRIQTRLPFAYEAWLAKLTHEQLLKITQFLNDLHYSLFDCLYCHNTALFMDTTDGTGVNFIFFDNGWLPCALSHTFYYSNKIFTDNQFDFLLANGQKFHLSD